MIQGRNKWLLNSVLHLCCLSRCSVTAQPSCVVIVATKLSDQGGVALKPNILSRTKVWLAIAVLAGMFLGFRVFLEAYVSANECSCMAFYLRATVQTFSHAQCVMRPIECNGWQLFNMGPLTVGSLFLLPLSLYLAWRGGVVSLARIRNPK